MSGAALAWPFAVFAAVGLAAVRVIRLPGRGVVPSARAGRAILWSSAAEGVGLFLAFNVVLNLHRPDWRLPAMALVVGLHFLPIAFAARFRPYGALGAALVASAAAGFAVGGTAGGRIAGVAAALALWVAALAAVARDRRAKRAFALEM